MSVIKIGQRLIGKDQPCYVIAEMSANHGGSLDRAMAIVQAAKEAGADAIKLQTYTPDTMTIDCDNEYFRLGDHPLWGGKTLYQLYQQAMTPWEWHRPLQAKAKELGIELFSSPFDETAVDFLEELHVPAYKIASFELGDDRLLRKVAATGKPIIMSTGMATREEITHAVDVLRHEGTRELALLRCVSSYPADPAEMRLSLVGDLEQSFAVVTGLSDHTNDSRTSMLAVAGGAKIIEKHLQLADGLPTADAAFSLTPAQFTDLVRDIRYAETLMGQPVFGPLGKEQASLRFRRSLFVVKDIHQGDILNEQNVRAIRPGHGLSPVEWDAVKGHRASKDIVRGTPLTRDMVL